MFFRKANNITTHLLVHIKAPPNTQLFKKFLLNYVALKFILTSHYVSLLDVILHAMKANNFFCTEFLSLQNIYTNIPSRQQSAQNKNCIAFTVDVWFRHMKMSSSKYSFYVFSTFFFKPCKMPFLFLIWCYPFFEISFHFKFITMVLAMIGSCTGHI